MHFIYLNQSGKPVEGSSGNFWVQAGVALPVHKLKLLETRVNGLLKSFHRENYDPRKTLLDANKLLHPRNAETTWTRAICKGFEKIVASLDLKFFLVVVDKRATDKPANPNWLLPLTYGYLMKPVLQYLRDADDFGAFVIPPGRPEDEDALAQIQLENMFGPQGRTSPLVASPLIQDPTLSTGLQIADFVATVTRRYHETVYPKLFAKQILVGYDALINSHYQGFVKPNTYQSEVTDFKGFKIRGYIYLWRRDARGHLRDDQPSSSEVAVHDMRAPATSPEALPVEP